MAVAVSTILLSPLSASPDSGAAVTDTHTSVRVTAAVALEASAPTGAAAVSRSGAPVGTSEMAGAHSGAETCRSVRLAAVFYYRDKMAGCSALSVECGQLDQSDLGSAALATSTAASMGLTDPLWEIFVTRQKDATTPDGRVSKQAFALSIEELREGFLLGLVNGAERTENTAITETGIRGTLTRQTLKSSAPLAMCESISGNRQSPATTAGDYGNLLTEAAALLATFTTGSTGRSVRKNSNAYAEYVKCRPARRAVVFYRLKTHTWQALRDGRLASQSPVVAGKSCHWAKFAAAEWQARARSARRSFYRWLHDRTLRDFAFAPGADAWPKAVREVQRVFGGTEGWLLSCSAAEGGHGRWVGYGGQGYSTWLRDSDTVGGPLQFRYSTFKGMFRRAVDHAYAHGYRVPIFSDYTAAWRSALGQALAGGWARATGNDDRHWSASWGNGC